MPDVGSTETSTTTKDINPHAEYSESVALSGVVVRIVSNCNQFLPYSDLKSRYDIVTLATTSHIQVLLLDICLQEIKFCRYGTIIRGRHIKVSVSASQNRSFTLRSGAGI
jgi:hypothetical protein